MYRKQGDAVGAMEHRDGQDAQDSFARGNVARVDVVLHLVDFCVDGVPRSIMTLVNVFYATTLTLSGLSRRRQYSG